MWETLTKSALLFLSIPFINAIAFGLGTLIHEMQFNTISDAQFAAYRTSMILLITAVALTILIAEFLHARKLRNNYYTSLLYLGSFSLIAWLTREQFSFRPWEHTLTFGSILTVPVTRIVLQKLVFARHQAVQSGQAMTRTK